MKQSMYKQNQKATQNEILGNRKQFKEFPFSNQSIKSPNNNSMSHNNSNFINQEMNDTNRQKFNFNIQDHEDLNRINIKSDSFIEFDYFVQSIKDLEKPNGNHNNQEFNSPINTLEDMDQLQSNPISSRANITNKNKLINKPYSNKDNNEQTQIYMKNSHQNIFNNKKYDENTSIVDTKRNMQIENQIAQNYDNNDKDNFGIEKHIQIYETDRKPFKRDRNGNIEEKQNSNEQLNLNQDLQRKNDGKKVIKDTFKLITYIFPKMRRFLETKTYSGKSRFITQDIRQSIDDSSDYQRKQMKNNLLNMILDFLESICVFLKLNKIPLFDPENMFKLFINSIIVAYNCFFLFITSVEVCFSAHFNNYQTIFHSIAMGAWVTEMLLQMNTATYHHNTFTKDRRIILKIYVKEYFFFEILPLLFEGKTSSSILLNVFLHLPLLLKIKGIMIIMKKIEFYALQMLEKHYILFLFKLCAKVIILGHVIACTRNIVSNFEAHVLGVQNTWLIEYQNQSWHVIYLECLYWSFAIMMHNLSEKPRNDIEYIYACLIMLLTSVIFGYMITSIGSILAAISKQKEEYKKDLNTLNTYMKRKKIDLQQFLKGS